MKSISSVIYNFAFPYYIAYIIFTYTKCSSDNLIYRDSAVLHKDDNNVSFIGTRNYMDVFPRSKQTLNLNL